MSELAELEMSLTTKIAAADTEVVLEQVRVAALGKKGVISEQMKTLGTMSAEQKKADRPGVKRAKDPHSQGH